MMGMLGSASRKGQPCEPEGTAKRAMPQAAIEVCSTFRTGSITFPPNGRSGRIGVTAPRRRGMPIGLGLDHSPRGTTAQRSTDWLAVVAAGS